jgi:tetratricopeptide (TPR) repeat protein
VASADLVDSLLPLALSQPGRALEAALRILAESADPRVRSIAHQTAAIVLRDRGQTDEAVAHGFAALRHARRVDTARQADVLGTLGIVLAFAGRTRDGLRRLEEAVPLSPATMLPRQLHRRAHVLHMLARNEEALSDLDRSIAGSHRLRDDLWEGRSLNTRCDVYLALGDGESAEADAIRAERLLTNVGQEFEAVQAVHNRGLAANVRGDVPTALRLLDDATARAARLGNVRHDLVIERSQVLLSAGLIDEVRDLCAATLPTTTSAPIRRAELLLTDAQAALAQADVSDAASSADRAYRLFRSQQRAGWADRARLLRLRAEYEAGRPGLGLWMADRDAPPPDEHSFRTPRQLLPAATSLVDSMRRRSAMELPVARVLLGRIAHDAGRDDMARQALSDAAEGRRHGSPLSRSAGWLAQALLAHQQDDRRALFIACRLGLDAVDEHRSLLGDVELRALASGHGIEFTRLAVDAALRSGRPRRMLWWAERWRAAALDAPGVRVDDSATRRDLAALRDVTRRLETADEDDDAFAALSRDRSRLEAAIRRAHRHQGPHGHTASGDDGMDDGRRFDFDALFAALGNDGGVVSIVRDGDTLHRLTAAQGTVRHTVIGSATRAATEADFARLALRRAALGRRVDLSSAGQALQSALLGADFCMPPGVDRVVVVPPAGLLTAPWGLLPCFRDMLVSVSPSVAHWLRVTRRPERTAPEHVALVTGPGLSTREAEVVNLSRIHRRAKVLHPDEATASAALEVIDGASLAHIAAHGTFRADAPLFSSLHLADGPLTVHDLRGLHLAPGAIVLSACDSGGAAPIGPFEALGLVTSLLGMGTATVLASVVPVNDEACLGVMADVHTVAARRGGTVAQGWLAARQAGARDSLAAATAASFTAWGA